jgi:hypothetical protein
MGKGTAIITGGLGGGKGGGSKAAPQLQQVAPVPRTQTSMPDISAQKRAYQAKIDQQAAEWQAQVDAQQKKYKEQLAANKAKRESEIKGQATKIVDTKLNKSRSQASLYGTRFRAPGDSEYGSLVAREFARLMKMDSGQQPENTSAAQAKKKYEGYRLGRGRNFIEDLSSPGLLGG